MTEENSRYIDVVHVMPLCVVTYIMYLLYKMELTHGDLFSLLVIVGMLLSVSYAINKTNLITLTVAFIFTIPVNVVLVLNGY